MFSFILGTIPSVFGKTRKAYLTDFILNNEIEGVGFTNSIWGENVVSNEATSYGLEILKFYGKSAHEITTLQENLEDNLKNLLTTNYINLYDLYFLLKTLNDLGYSLGTSLKYWIHNFLNDTAQVSGGFSFSNRSTSVSLSSTYHIIQLYSIIGETIVNDTIHKNWVLSCYNADGGYGGNSSLSSKLINTYYAVSIINDLGDISDMVNISNTITYINSFYVGNAGDQENYGGYLPDATAENALLSSTFYAVGSLSLIDENELNKDQTTKWILNRQSFQDGGFADNSEGYKQLFSSITASYYAFQTLRIFDPSLGSLSKEIFMVEFNYWILAIVLGCIGAVIAIAYVIWRKRRI